MWRYVPVVVSAIALVAGGIIPGRATTARQGDIGAAVSALQALPATIGNWEGTQFEFPTDQLITADVAGCLSRRYVNRVDGNEITLIIFCGRPGPISLHAPTVCFPSAGLNLESDPARCTVSVDGISAEFWTGDFVKVDGGVPVRLRTYWAWHGNGAWQIPTNPRLTFASQPYIYKMYVTQAVDGSRANSADDPCRIFIRTILPDLQHVLGSQMPK